MRRPALLACAAAVVAASAWFGAVPAQAATQTPQACPTKGTPKTNPCIVSWTGTAFSPTTASIPQNSSVLFSNADTGLTKGNVTVSRESGSTKFATFTLKPKETKVILFSAAGKELVKGVSSRLGNPSSVLTINVAAPPPQPKPSPTRPPTTAPRPGHPSKPATHAPAPAPAPAPGQAAPPLGVTNPPPLGVGTIPTPAPSAPGPGPQVAAPDVPLAPEPEPTIQADVPHALSQPVPARKYGLPGALAAVLLAGVAVGVVRAARTEIATGSPQDEPDQPKD